MSDTVTVEQAADKYAKERGGSEYGLVRRAFYEGAEWFKKFSLYDHSQQSIADVNSIPVLQEQGEGAELLRAKEILERESVILSIDTGKHISKHWSISDKAVYDLVIRVMFKFKYS